MYLCLGEPGGAVTLINTDGHVVQVHGTAVVAPTLLEDAIRLKTTTTLDT